MRLPNLPSDARLVSECAKWHPYKSIARTWFAAAVSQLSGFALAPDPAVGDILVGVVVVTLDVARLQPAFQRRDADS